MTKEQNLELGLAIQGIAMSVDDKTLKRIKPMLEKITRVAEDIGVDDGKGQE